MPGLIKIYRLGFPFSSAALNENMPLMSASPSRWRQPCLVAVIIEYLGANVFPNMFSLAMAHKAFNADDN